MRKGIIFPERGTIEESHNETLRVGRLLAVTNPESSAFRLYGLRPPAIYDCCGAICCPPRFGYTVEREIKTRICTWPRHP